MSFVGRWWRALDQRYDIVDTWPITFTVLTLSVLLSLPSLLYYTYGQGEDVERYSYYHFDYGQHWNPLTSSSLHSLQLWRLLTSQLVFSSASELVLGSALLLLLRPIEARLTSSTLRTSALLALILALSIVYHSIIPLSNDALFCAAGPYWLCFFLLPLYLLLHPPSFHVKLCSTLSLSNKLLPALLSVQFMLFLVPQSLLSAAVPVGLSLVYAGVLWCSEGGMERVTNPHRPQGMRVGRRGEEDGGRRSGSTLPGVGVVLGGPAPAAEGGRPHAPRPASHYEKLVKNAKPGVGGGVGGGAVSPKREGAEMVNGVAGGVGRVTEPMGTWAPGQGPGGVSHSEVVDSDDSTLVGTARTRALNRGAHRSHAHLTLCCRCVVLSLCGRRAVRC